VASKVDEILLKAGVVDELQLRSAHAHQEQWGGFIGQIVVDKRFASEDAVLDALAAALRVNRVDLDELPKDKAALARVSVEFAKQNSVFPCALKDNGKTLVVAFADPSNIAVQDSLALLTRSRIRPVLASEAAIRRAIERHYLGREPGAGVNPLSFGTFAPIGFEEGAADEGKIVDMAGNTLVKNIKDIVPPQPPAPPVPPPAPAPAGNALDELLGAAPPRAALSPEQLARAKSIQEQQQKGARVLKAVLDLLVEKGWLTLEEYRTRIKR
jgi:hypothetical protein